MIKFYGLTDQGRLRDAERSQGKLKGRVQASPLSDTLTKSHTMGCYTGAPQDMRPKLMNGLPDPNKTRGREQRFAAKDAQADPLPAFPSISAVYTRKRRKQPKPHVQPKPGERKPNRSQAWHLRHGPKKPIW